MVAVETLQETVGCNPADTHRVGIQLRLVLLLVLFKTATIVRGLLEGTHKDNYPFLKAPTLKSVFPMDWLDAKSDEEIYNYSNPKKAEITNKLSIEIDKAADQLKWLIGRLKQLQLIDYDQLNYP